MVKVPDRIEYFDDEEHIKGPSTNIAGPLSAWIMLLFISLVIQVLLSNSAISGTNTGGVGPWLLAVANFILNGPGNIILPLIIGAAIGAEVGVKSDSLRKAERSGLFNGLYASVIYIIAIVVIYEILNSLLPQVAPAISSLMLTWISIPVIILIAITEVFSILSHTRRVND